ncbi:MAG: DUF4142 domain-containing protein [Rhizobiales bacterium]|nr:DUF4142 domain-containing protein [Hyphomicrobiales bacterium]
MYKKSLIAAAAALAILHGAAFAKSPAELNDLEIAHVAYTADNSDIRYAHLALAISKDPKIHEFARTMIRDHSAVNDQALALLQKLKVQPQDNSFSKQLRENTDKLIAEMSKLSGKAFDRRYAENELGYQQAVNKLVEDTFIPNIENPQVKALFEDALAIFKGHEMHAAEMVKALAQRQSMQQQ